MPNYNVWTDHGERGIILEDGEEEDDFVSHFEHNYHDAFFEDIAMGEPEEDAEGHVVEDDLGQILREAEEGCETEKDGTIRSALCLLC